jgi:hypothetical protein
MVNLLTVYVGIFIGQIKAKHPRRATPFILPRLLRKTSSHAREAQAQLKLKRQFFGTMEACLTQPRHP